MPIRYELYKDFAQSLNKLREQGGIGQKKAEKVQAILGRINLAEQDPFHGVPVTNHGENRIDHCIKYDLTDGYRLVTIQNNSMVFFLFVGKHEHVEKWIERNKDLKISINKKGEIDVLKSYDISDNSSFVVSITNKKLLDELGNQYKRVIAEIVNDSLLFYDAMNFSFTTDDKEIEVFCKKLSPNIANAIYNILVSIKKSDTHNAIELIDILKGDSKIIGSLSKNEILSIKDGDSFKEVKIDSAEYFKEILKLIASPHYQDWMLFTHSEQQTIIDSNFDGPAILSGVSGSGKTCIVVHRAIRIAKETSIDRKVLILTLNQSLSTLIKDLLDYACIDANIRNKIICKSFFDLCKEMLLEFEPENSRCYDFLTWKMNEHIDSIWREFYRCEANNSDADVLSDIHKTLIVRKINAESYVRQEFDYVRTIHKREYSVIEREGRAIPLLKKDREQILQGLKFWEIKMRAIGITDYVNISSNLYKHIDKINPKYYHVLIDEAQDFGTSELNIIRHITHNGANDLFFAGDIAQTILPKHQDFKLANIDFGKRKLKIQKNYRNSKEILQAAYDILINDIEKCEYILSNNNIEILDPQYANRHSSLPLVLSADNLNDEIAFAIELANTSQLDKKICICFSGYSTSELCNFAYEYGYVVLDGTNHLGDNNVFVSDLEQMKGFEFDIVIILNCNYNVIPNPFLPLEESFRDICRLYVAMTRSKNELIISFSKNHSPIFDKSIANGSIALGAWDEYYDKNQKTQIVPPKHIPQFTDSQSFDISKLSGKQFLYTDYAFWGLSKDLLEKLEALVDGKGATKARSYNKIRWKNLGEAYVDVVRHPHAKLLFGPKLYLEFLEFFEPLMPTRIRDLA